MSAAHEQLTLRSPKAKRSIAPPPVAVCKLQAPDIAHPLPRYEEVHWEELAERTKFHGYGYGELALSDGVILMLTLLADRGGGSQGHAIFCMYTVYIMRLRPYFHLSPTMVKIAVGCAMAMEDYMDRMINVHHVGTPSCLPIRDGKSQRISRIYPGKHFNPPRFRLYPW